MILARVAGWERHDLHDLCNVFPGLDMYGTKDPAQDTVTAGWVVIWIIYSRRIHVTKVGQWVVLYSQQQYFYLSCCCCCCLYPTLCISNSSMFTYPVVVVVYTQQLLIVCLFLLLSLSFSPFSLFVATVPCLSCKNSANYHPTHPPTRDRACPSARPTTSRGLR